MKEDNRSKMAMFCKAMIKHSPANIPHPLPLIERKAKERLSTDGLISFHILMKEWKNISMEDKKIISKLLILNSHDVIESLDLFHDFAKETNDTVDFINEHPEYANQGNGSILDDLSGLFDDDDD